jgi:hypothetical protein
MFYFLFGTISSKPHFFGCSNPPLSWENFYGFAIDSMVPKIAKRPKKTGPSNTNHIR